VRAADIRPVEEGKGRLRRGRGLERSLTLLRVFLLASALICAGTGVALGWLLSHSLTAEALGAEETALVQYVHGAVGPVLVHGGRLAPVSGSRLAYLRRSVRAQPDILSVKVWRADGLLAWTNVDQKRIGHRFPLDEELGDAIHEDQAVASLIGTGGPAQTEDAFERNQLARGAGVSHLFEVYAPIEGTDASQAIGAYEIYANPSALGRLIGSRRTMLWFAVGGVFLALWAALALLVRGASHTLSRQNAKLRARTLRLVESNRLLEESALEAVESLNATVDAKDPYTAGHSQRVQRIAVALGRELGLARDRLDVLRFAGLFHDIGKIGVPDAILTKPARLTELEFEIVKRHPEDGARIVGRLHRLNAAVPAILHHHERWDGQGYPRGLRGNDIPRWARVFAVVDTVDAMTSDRPYRAALPLQHAIEELRNQAGRQFDPDCVAAFERLDRDAVECVIRRHAGRPAP